MVLVFVNDLETFDKDMNHFKLLIKLETKLKIWYR